MRNLACVGALLVLVGVCLAFPIPDEDQQETFDLSDDTVAIPTGYSLWSSPASWPSGVPTSGANVVIDTGKKILMDTSPPALGSITIKGTLMLLDTQLDVVTPWIKLIEGGRLLAGSPTAPVTNKIVITLTGARSTASPIGTEQSDGATFGSKGIAVSSGCSIELYGDVRGVVWTRLSATAHAGATVLHVQHSVTWSVGDEIVVTTTDYHGHADGAAYQTEYATVAAVAGTKITIDRALKYMHWGAGHERAEVGLLTRKIKIQGDESSVQSTFGGHLMIRAAKAARLVGVEFTRMGQQGLMGRYPVHFHKAYDVIGKGYLVEHCAIHHNFQRCVAIHDTMGITVNNNVAAYTNGHCLFLEDGSEYGNVFTNNLAVDPQPVPEGDLQLLPTDSEPTPYWITNPNNTYVGNVAVGGKFGFWFALPKKPNGLSEQKYNLHQWIWPRYTPLGKFDNNMAHSAAEHGLMIDDMQKMDGSTETAGYTPKVGPYTTTKAEWEYEPEPAKFHNFVAYKCRSNGIWTRGDNLYFYNVTLLDNLVGVLLIPGPSIVDGGLIVGETDNIGTPTHLSWIPDMPRNRPVHWTNNVRICGFENYDNGGPQFLKNVEFQNFQPNKFRSAGAIGVLLHGPFALRAMNRYSNLKFTNAQRVYVNNITEVPEKASEMTRVFAALDVDGTTTGHYGTWVLANQPLLKRQGCVEKTEMNAQFCPRDFNTYVNVRVENRNPGETDFGTSSQGLYTAEYFALGSNTNGLKLQGRDNRYGINVEARRGYYMHFNHTTPPSLRLSVEGAANGEWVIVALSYPNVQFQLKKSGNINLSPVTALADIDAESYYYDAASQYLYVKLASTKADTTFLDGFVSHGSYASYVVITASCSRAACKAKAGVAPVHPFPREDRFKALLQACQVSSSTVPAGTGTAYLHFDVSSLTLSYRVDHTLGDTVTHAHIHTGLPGNSGSVVFTLDGTASPIQGAVRLSNAQWAELTEGKYYINLHTAAHPAGALRGQIGCVGSCASPPRLTAPGSTCSAAGQVLLGGALPQGWSSWSWGVQPTDNDASSSPAVCGSAFKVVYTSAWGAFAPVKYPNGVTADIGTNSVLEFWVRSTETLEGLRVSFKKLDESSSTRVHVGASHLENKLISAQWTLARIPMSEFGYTASSVTFLGLELQLTRTGTLFFDEIKLVPSASSSTLALLQHDVAAGLDIVEFNGNICQETASPPSSSPAPPPSPTTTPAPPPPSSPAPATAAPTPSPTVPPALVSQLAAATASHNAAQKALDEAHTLYLAAKKSRDEALVTLNAVKEEIAKYPTSSESESESEVDMVDDSPPLLTMDSEFNFEDVL